MFSISELACASSNGSVLIKTDGLGISSAAPFNSASAARARIHCLRIGLVSRSTLGGSSGISLYRLFACQDRLVREDCESVREAAISEEFMLALLTRQRDMLKTERFFNTLRQYVAVFYISARFDLHSNVNIGNGNFWLISHNHNPSRLGLVL